MVPPLGAHLSTAGGMARAIERACALECTALQMFTQAPGRWRGRVISEAEAARFRSAQAAAGLAGACFSHTPYLINVASGDDQLRVRSADLLADQLRQAHRLDLAGVVLHPGSHRGCGVVAGIKRARDTIGEVLEREPLAPPLLIEVTAGQGTNLGCGFAEIGAILDGLPAARVGVCWDTAHMWGAGQDLVSEQGWEGVWREFTELTGRTAPELVHLNDTAVELGSRIDRHQRIGHGKLGFATFKRLLRDYRLAGIPMVIETPKSPDEVSWDREALQFLRQAAVESC